MAPLDAMAARLSPWDVSTSSAASESSLFRDAAPTCGCKRSLFRRGKVDSWTVDLPDDTAAAAFSLALGTHGRNRPETMRAFILDEIQAIVDKLP